MTVTKGMRGWTAALRQNQELQSALVQFAVWIFGAVYISIAAVEVLVRRTPETAPTGPGLPV